MLAAILCTRSIRPGAAESPPGRRGRKKKRSIILNISGFKTREEYERELRAAIKESGLVVVKQGKSIVLPTAEQIEEGRLTKGTELVSAADREIKVSGEVMLEIEKFKDDEMALMLILAAIVDER